MEIHVLICTDGSDLAISAVGSSLPVLAAAGKISVLTVESIVDPDHQTGSGFTIEQGAGSDHEQIETSGDRFAKQVLDETVDALGLHGATLMARVGKPGQTICDVAGSVGADVIVIGTHGHGGFKRAIVGSTSDYVIRHAACPVLVQGATTA